MLVEVIMNLFKNKNCIEIDLEMDLEVDPELEPKLDFELSLEYNFCKY